MAWDKPERDQDRIQIQVDIDLEHPVDLEDLRRAVQVTLESEGRPEGEITLVLTDDKRISELNRAYAGVDAATDVLAFSAREGNGAFVAAPEATDYLGDIVIAVPFAARQAEEVGHPLAAELRLLAVHGTLHLLGYDHATEEERREMWRRQEAILAMLPPIPSSDPTAEEG
ncbi:MAG TPA: rRNA maturation RNase YbeY [Caldilineae bacterium]|nr:rRNA maturation RNase YbeY [Caldilineae bacterium]